MQLAVHRPGQVASSQPRPTDIALDATHVYWSNFGLPTDGGGPTLTLGRIAFIQRGFLDLRIGYDLLYGLINPRIRHTR